MAVYDSTRFDPLYRGNRQLARCLGGRSFRTPRLICVFGILLRVPAHTEGSRIAVLSLYPFAKPEPSSVRPGRTSKESTTRSSG